MAAQAAITKYHQLGGFNNRTSFLTVLEVGSPEIEVLAGLASPKASLLDLQMATFLLLLHMVVPLCRNLLDTPLVIRTLIRLDEQSF